MWSDDLDVIIVGGDGDDREGLGGQGDTSEDLSTRHCEEKRFLIISCGLESRQKLSVRSPAGHTDLQWRTGFTPSNLTRFHLRALLGHRNADGDDEDDDSQKKRALMMRWTFFMTLSFCHSAPRSSRTMKSSYNLSLTHCPGISILHSGLACLKRRQTGRRL